MNTLPVQLAHQLCPQSASLTRWLVDELWSDQAVGILGGEPKCCKSFLALDIAVSVAAGVPCLRRFPVTTAGPVLLFPAEDSLAVLLVHHARKDAGSTRPGQALRGSSELHGWGDVNLYMRRRADALTLCTEHRAAPSPNHIPLELTQSDQALSLSVLNSDDPECAACEGAQEKAWQEQSQRCEAGGIP